MSSCWKHLLYVCLGAAALSAQTSPLTITSISPNSRPAGSAQFELTINGTNFNTCTRARWNGQILANAVVDSEVRMRVPIPANLVASAGTAQVSLTRFNFAVGSIALICGSTVSANSNNVPFTIAAPFTISTTNPLPQGRRFEFYSTQLEGSGGTPPYSFVAAQTLPAGLTLSSNGVLSGSPTAAGTFSFAVRASDSGQQNASRTFQITIVDPPRIPTEILNSGTVCLPYNFQMQGVGGVTPYTWFSTSLPPGLSINPNTGVISGTPSQAGAFRVSITARGADGTDSRPAAYTLTIASSNLNINTTSLPNGTVGVQYSQTLSGTAGTTATWSATGLPPGLSLSTAGVLSGTPSQAGTFQPVFSLANCVSRSIPITINGPALQITTASLPAGQVQTQYSVTMQRSGGAAPFTWSATGLPSGLQINPSTGVVSGAPTQAGTSQVTFRVTDSQENTATRTLALTINAPTLQITTTTLTAGQVGVLYSQTLQRTGGVAPFTWSVDSGDLPPGLQLNPATGSITGTPAQAATAQITFRVTDAQENTATRTLALTITAPSLQITTTALPNGQVQVPYSEAIQASGGTPPFSWTTIGSPPSGVILNPATGVLSGTPTLAQSATFTVRVTDSRQVTASRNFTVVIQPAQLQITTTAIDSGRVGVAYSQALATSGGAPPFSWSFTGNLPSGITLNPATGVLSGTPSQSGTFNFTAQVSDSRENQATRSFTLTISASTLTITTATLPTARIGQIYDVLLQATGGTGQLVWTPVGSLPSGFSLAPNGTFAGTPTLSGDFSISVQVRDSAGATATRSYVLTVSQGLIIVTDSLPPAVTGTAYEEPLLASGGTLPYRWVMLSGIPPGLSLDLLEGILRGTPTQAGNFNINVQVTDSTQATATRLLQLRVSTPFQINTATLSSGSIGRNYNQTLVTSGGTAPVRFELAEGSLPGGLTLNATNGLISGAPTAVGDFTFTVRATDNAGQTAQRTYTVTIQGTFRITTESLPGGAVEAAYSQTIATTGGTAPLTFRVTQGSLPAGLAINATTGAITGTPTDAGEFSFTVQATDRSNQQATQRYTIAIIGRLTILTETLPGGVTGSAYETTIEVAGGEPPYTFSITGILPSGLTLNTNNGAIRGTPSRTGEFRFTVRAQDRANRTASREFTIAIGSELTIAQNAIGNAVIGVPFTHTFAATGGSGARTWSVTAGSLPAGLALVTSTGVVSGTPRTIGTSNFTVTVRDAAGGTASRAASITVGPLEVPGFNLTSGNVVPGNQIAASLNLASPAPATLNGTLAIAFASEFAPRNPQVSFSTGPTARFTVAQGQTTASFPDGPLSIQVGTIAGTITVTARYTSNGVDVTPNPAPTRTITVASAPPSISSLQATRTNNTITITAVGFATTREAINAEFQFAVAPGSSVTGTNATVPVRDAFNTWYQNAQSLTFGSAFTLSIPFTITGDASVFTGVTVTLVSGAGRSQPVAAQIR